jgi:hypothetical protein
MHKQLWKNNARELADMVRSGTVLAADVIGSHLESLAGATWFRPLK